MHYTGHLISAYYIGSTSGSLLVGLLGLVQGHTGAAFGLRPSQPVEATVVEEMAAEVSPRSTHGSASPLPRRQRPLSPPYGVSPPSHPIIIELINSYTHN
jgi:hypothetical protein